MSEENKMFPAILDTKELIKATWNEAIEVALAKVCETFGNETGIAEEIRKLKK